jgi:hypothetical protein
MKATGTFEVNLQPLPLSTEGKDGLQLGRMSIDKTFSGDLQAASKGEMLSAMAAEKGHAGYVAIEQVSGNLLGKSGSFALQHFGTMAGTNSRLILEVVPGSGTGELKGLSGTMQIDQSSGTHAYSFEFTLEN